MRQLIGTTFYLFGFVFFLTLPFAAGPFGDSRTPIGWLILNTSLMFFSVAANVLFVFLVLHSVQWFASARVRAFALRLNIQHII
ncbi:MAG: hypothetical protein ACRD41_17435 [Candidatus Acidiferrales bacterium]